MLSSTDAPPRRVTEDELERAGRELARAERARDDRHAAYLAECRQFHPIRDQRQFLVGRLRSYKHMAPTRDFFDRTMTKPGGAVVCVVTSVGLTIIGLGLLGAPTWLQFILTSVVFLVALGFGKSLLVSDDEIRGIKARLTAITLDYSEAQEAYSTTKTSFEIADRHAQRAAADLASLRDLYDQYHGAKARALLTCGWEQMRGVPFENFLVQVFENLGYTVQTTRTTGDHGVDLIASKGPCVIAVQAKGYPSSTVGNGAVQEAYSGMAFYRRLHDCNRSAVITNSTFTKAAKEAAHELGCVLIDGAAIPALIRGEIAL
jgi:HJR/Mrr/RecB family endonuclease